jgi:hypothetical protein
METIAYAHHPLRQFFGYGLKKFIQQEKNRANYMPRSKGTTPPQAAEYHHELELWTPQAEGN